MNHPVATTDEEIIARFDSVMTEARRTLYLSGEEQDCQIKLRACVKEACDLLYSQKHRRSFPPNNRFATVLGMAKLHCNFAVRKQRTRELLWSIIRDSRYYDV